jgi:hypothetical protein
MWVRTGAYPRAGYVKDAPLMQAWDLNCKHETRLEGVARDKHYSLLQKFLNFGCKKRYNIFPR